MTAKVSGTCMLVAHGLRPGMSGLCMLDSLSAELPGQPPGSVNLCLACLDCACWIAFQQSCLVSLQAL